MKNPYQNARFTLSVDHLKHLPADQGYEVAFAGRSNSGKSSSINAICNQRSLARTSKTPGRTQQLLFFNIDDDRRLVDLPGYGYAKVSESVKKQWQKTVEGYLNGRHSLKGLVLTMDIRHPMREFDQQLLSWCEHVNMPVHILLTKSDKLKKGASIKVQQQVKQALKDYAGSFSVQLFSSTKKTGLSQVIDILNTWLKIESEATN